MSFQIIISLLLLTSMIIIWNQRKAITELERDMWRLEHDYKRETGKVYHYKHKSSRVFNTVSPGSTYLLTPSFTQEWADLNQELDPCYGYPDPKEMLELLKSILQWDENRMIAIEYGEQPNGDLLPGDILSKLHSIIGVKKSNETLS